MTRVVVMGVAGCGKSTLGALLAQHLGAPFIEGDALHPKSNVEKMASGTPLTDEDRAPWLRAVGAALAAGDPMVAACSALKRRYRDVLREIAGPETAFVYPMLDEAALTQRMTQRVGHFMPASLLASQLRTLEAPQADERTLTLDAQRAPEAMVEEILAWLRN